jgi:hypothetical protein
MSNAARPGEPLFVVISRVPQIRTQFAEWLAANRNAQARMEDHRLQIMDQNTLNLFTVTWTHGWDEIVIWDTWLRRHI